MDNNVGEDHVDLQEKKEAYREKDEEEAEEDHLSLSYASILTLPTQSWRQSNKGICLYLMQTMVVRHNFVSPNGRNLWANCIRLQPLRLDRALEAHPRSDLDQIRGSIYLRSQLVRSQGSLAGKERKADSFRVLAINAVSFVIAIIANMFLLANNFGRIPFKIAQPATIMAWYIASFMLIGLVAAAPSHLALPPGQARTFSQAYYYAVLAAALYFVVASLLVATASGVWFGRYSSDFKLTFSQKTLMIQVLLFLGYLLAAAAVYAYIEDWDYLDAVYWVDVTIFTIGYGDFSPKTHLGRSLFFPMAIGGILFVGLIVASVSTLALDRASTKVSIRMVEKARQKALKKFNPETGSTNLRLFKQWKVEDSPSSELERREQEFDIMREIQRKAANDNRMLALGISLGVFVILWFIGAVAFWQAEKGAGNWSYFESLYVFPFFDGSQ